MKNTTVSLEEIVNYLLEKGYSLNSSKYYGNKIYNEWFGMDANKYSDEQKKWAYDHGYLAEIAELHNLNEENYKDFLNSEDYFLLDPIDPITKRLVDGKLTIHYTIGGKYPEYMPKYYCWINERKIVVPMTDNPVEKYDGSIESYLKELLDKVDRVAIKPLAGAGGIGFLKLEKMNGEYYANNKKIDSIFDIIPLIDNQYVVTEYIDQCSEFNEIWKDSAATLRIISCNIDNNSHVYVSFVRFGTALSKGASNLTAGGVAAPFDWKTGEFTGEFYRYKEFCEDGNIVTDKHPDSGIELKGKKIPHFEEVKKLVENLSSYLSVHKFFGFDVIIGDDCVKICEINSHPSMDYAQEMVGGIWSRNDEISAFFKNELEIKKARKKMVSNK